MCDGAVDAIKKVRLRFVRSDRRYYTVCAYLRRRQHLVRYERWPQRGGQHFFFQQSERVSNKQQASKLASQDYRSAGCR